MKEAGYERNFQQCRDKIKKLKVEYKKVKDKEKKTGEGKTKWEFFDGMYNILGDRPSTILPVVLDSLETEKEAAAELENSDLEEDERDKEVEERDSEADY